MIDLDISKPENINKFKLVLDYENIKIKNYIHCSGIIEPLGSFDDHMINDFNEILNVNYFSMMSFINNFISIFNPKSKILMIGSLLGQVYLRHLAFYCFSKNLMYNSYNVLKTELNSKEVYVGYVMPGVVKTNMADKLQYNDKSLLIEPKICVDFLDFLLKLDENEFQKDVWDIYDEKYFKYWYQHEKKIFPPHIV